MAFVFANTGEDYKGDTHFIFGHHWSGATRTPSSKRLIEVPDAPKKAAPSSTQKSVVKEVPSAEPVAKKAKYA